MEHSTLSTFGVKSAYMANILSSKTIRRILVAILMISANILCAQEPAPVNDLCDDAELIQCGETLEGSTEFATNTDAPEFCDPNPFNSGNTAPGVWYSFIGTGGEVTISADNDVVDYDIYLNVYTGDCNDLTCVVGDDDSGDGFDAIAIFDSELDVVYSIYITGYDGQAPLEEAGIYEFVISCEPFVPNDHCEDAIEIFCGNTIEGSTMEAASEDQQTCGTSNGSGGAVWYSFLGTGDIVTLTTCNPGTNYDSKIRVYSGICDDLMCIGGDDDDLNCGFSGLSSTVEFLSEEGTVYYILVHGFGFAEGNFELSIECVEPCINVLEIDCPNNVTIQCGESIDPLDLGEALAFNVNLCDFEFEVSYEDNFEFGCPSTITRNWFAFDLEGLGLYVECDQVITIEDNVNPYFTTFPEDITIECSVAQTEAEINAYLDANVTLPAGDDDCSDVSLAFEVTTNTNVACPEILIYEREYTLTDGCNEISQTFTVIIVDTEAPVFDDYDAIVNVQCLEDTPDPLELEATDACSGNSQIAEVFESNTGELIASCDLSTAFGAGDDWAVWLPGLFEGGLASSSNYHFDDNGGTLDQFNDGTAHLYGTIVNDTNPLESWEVDFWFQYQSDWTQWSDMGRGYKDDLGCAQPDLFEDWTYYEMVDGFSSMTGLGDFAGDELYFYHKPVSHYFGFQLGQGANNKNCDYGFSGWFTYDGFVDGEYVEGHGDVNANAECEEGGETDCIHDTEFTYLYRVEDECNNADIAQQVIIVNDTTPPTFTLFPDDLTIDCQDWPLPVDEVAAEDNCVGDVTILEVVEEMIEGSCPHSFTIERTWRAIDICNNFQDMTQTITVIDEEAPVMSGLPSENEITVECDAVPEAPVVNATDNCSLEENIVLTYNEVLTEGNCPGNYTLTRTWTAEDECENISEFIQIVNVQDSTPPVFEDHPIYLSLECDEVDGYTLTATDNCGSAIVEIIEETLNSGGCMGVLMRIYEATDLCGNTTVVEQYITIIDSTPPTLVGVPEDATLECSDVELMEDGNYFDDGGVEGEDNCMLDVEVEYSEEVQEDGDDCENSFIIVRTWFAVDYCENEAMEQQTVTVVDTTDPVFDELPLDVTIQCSDPIPAVVMPTATDNCDVDVVVVMTSEEEDGTCEDEYFILRTFRATDNCGNEAMYVQTIHIVDTTDPELTVGEDMTIECDLPIPEPFSSASDNCDEDVEVIVTPFIIDGNCPQEYTLERTYVATDNCGNSTTLVQTINVIDSTSPELSIPEDQTLECDQDIPEPSYVVSDNCDLEVSVTVTPATIPGNCPQEYMLIRSYYAVDDCGNSTTLTETITVVDNTAPVFDPFEIEIEMPCDDIDETITVNATDNCGVVTITKEDTYVSGSCAGTIIREYTATDECFNSTNATQIIVLIDDVDPEFTSFPADVTVECSDYIPTAEDGLEDISYDDICTDVELSEVSEEIVDGLCPQEYYIERTWTITDDCDNTTSMTWTVHVQDTTPPDLEIANNITIECDDEVPAPESSVEDNCDNDIIVQVSEIEEGDSCDKTITRTYSATDDCGNSTEMVQIIYIEDSTAPEVFPAGNVTIECGDDIPLPEYTTYDNCNSVTVVVTEMTNDDDPCDVEIIRTYTPTDSCGNVGTPQYQSIYIIDTTAPVFDPYEPEIEMPCNDIDETITVTATDNCNSFEITKSDTYVSGSCAGIIIRTYYATDICDNQSSVTQIITLIDEVDPEFTSFPADLTVECSDYIPTAEDGEEEIDFFDICTDVELSEVSEITVDGLCPQEYYIERTWTITDECDNSTSLTWTIHVVDTTDPTLEVGQSVTIECDDEIPAPFSVVNDNCDNNIDVVVIESEEGDSCSKTITRTYTATDDCGNSTSMIQFIFVEDTTPPTIEIGPSVTINCDEEVPSEDLYTTDDNCNEVDVDIVEAIEGGDYCYTIFRTYYAEDACGNAAAPVSQIIIVEDNLPPVIDGDLTNINVQCADDVPSFNDWSVTDNCDPNPTVNTNEEYLEGPDECGNYVKLITCSAYDICGNQSQPVSFTVTVDDTIDPEFNETVEPVIVLDCFDDIPEFLECTATDNCGGFVEVDSYENIIGDLPNPDALNECMLLNPSDQCDLYDFPWALLFTDGYLDDNEDYQAFTLVEGTWLDFDGGTASLTATVVSLTNPEAGFYIDVNFENMLTYAEWISQEFPTGIKSDCYDPAGAEEDWLFYIMSEGGTLEGWGDFDGSFLSLSHAPANYFYGYQVGVGANNQSPNYGSGGWFTYSGTFIDSSNEISLEVSGAGDFSLERNCCPQYSIERVWCAIDCSGNEVCMTQNISFEGDGIPTLPSVFNESDDIFADKGDKGESIVKVTPNPASEKAYISFLLPQDGTTVIEVYNLAGDLVATIFNQEVEANRYYQAMLDVTNLSDGLYIYQVITGENIITDRIIVSK